MRLSSLVTVAIMVCWGAGVPAASPPNLHEALRAQQAEANLHPNDPEIMNDLGNLLVLAGSLDQAEEAYRRSLEIDPDNVTTRYNLALVLMEQGRDKLATKELQHVLDLDPAHAWACYQLGTISASLGRRSKAVAYYTRALTLNPELASPAVNPHILENHYVTESQLRRYLANLEAAQAPRLYQRPEQVTELLIPPVETEVQPAPTADPDAEPEGRTLTLQEKPSRRVGESAVPYPVPPPADAQPTSGDEPVDEGSIAAPETDAQVQATQADDAGSDRGLTEEDLAPTNVGQGVGYAPSSGTAPSSRPSTRSRGTVVSPPGTTTPRSGYPSSPTQPQPSPQTRSFVPSVGSTGRLELELFDEDGSPVVAPGP